MYAYLLLQFPVVFPGQSLCKKFILITFAYQKLLDSEISKTRSKIKEFSFCANFVVILEAFELIYDCSILCFPIVFPVWNVCRTFQFGSMNVSKFVA